MDILCSLKMLNAHLYNAQYKHLTYIHLISQNSYSPTKNVSMTAEIRDAIFALKCYDHTSQLDTQSIRNLSLNFNDKIFGKFKFYFSRIASFVTFEYLVLNIWI